MKRLFLFFVMCAFAFVAQAQVRKFHYCPVKILDLEINRVDHHPLGR